MKKKTKKEGEEQEQEEAKKEEKKKKAVVYLKAPPGGRMKVHPPAPSITHTHSYYMYIYTQSLIPTSPFGVFYSTRLPLFLFSLLEFHSQQFKTTSVCLSFHTYRIAKTFSSLLLIRGGLAEPKKIDKPLKVVRRRNGRKKRIRV